jgi:hypothetical protein
MTAYPFGETRFIHFAGSYGKHGHHATRVVGVQFSAVQIQK